MNEWLTDKYCAWLTSLWSLNNLEFPTAQPSKHTRNTGRLEGWVLKWVSHHRSGSTQWSRQEQSTLWRSHDWQGAALGGRDAAAVCSASGSQSTDTTRRSCANNIFCQCDFSFSRYVATLLSGKPLSLHWETLILLQHLRFFCIWKDSFLWKNLFFFSLFSHHFTAMKFGKKVPCLNLCVCVHERSHTVSRQSAIESNDCPSKWFCSLNYSPWINGQAFSSELI